ncbi:response regulator, partial [Teichococcus vastitatis]|uniref:response regulator n=1 Tax=Teichococcus vastitatis TaxID=2307076 RepID=UPI001EE44674
EPGQGTGLGLSMAHGLAAQSGGRLILRSKPAQGTTAELWLPVIHQQPRTEQLKADAEALMPLPQRPPLTILAVDDDPLVLANTAAMLEDLGHIVLQAASGQEALAIAKARHRLDLVVTDQAMPGMTGTQLGAHLRCEQPNLPVLLVSGYADLPLGSGSNLPRLNKPFQQVTLAQAVEAAITPPASATVTVLHARCSEGSAL